MPGRLIVSRPVAGMAAHMGADASGLSPQPPRHNVAPGQSVVVCPVSRVLSEMRWGMIPVGRVNARGRPVMETIVNARGETLFDKSAFAGLARGLVAADGWYEWTGKARRKTAWRIRRADGAPLLFCAVHEIWRAPNGAEIAQVATVTCAPSPDVAVIHHRMGAIIAPCEIATWLGGSEAEAAALIRPLPEGALTVEAADVDWTAP